MKKHLILLSLSLAGITSISHAANLMSVYHQAVKNDPIFAQDEATWLKAKEAMPLAMAGVLPKVDITGNGGYNYNKNNSGTLRQKYYSYGFGATVTQPIFNISNWYNIASASKSVKAATATYSAAAQNLIQRTATAYFTVLKDSSTLEYDEAEKKSLLSQLMTERQKYKVGLVAITNVYQVQSKYDGVVATEIADQNQLQNDLENLTAITNHRYQSIAALQHPVPLYTPKPTNINAWVNIAEKQNYNLLAQRYSVLASQNNVASQAAKRYPTLNFQGGAAHNKTNVNGPYQSNNTATLSLNADFPVYQGGSISATTAQARADYLNASATLVQTHRSVINNTRQAYLGIISEISKIHADKQAIVSAEKSLEATKAGYTVGTQTMTDVLEQVSTLYSAKKDYWSDQYDYINDLISLKLSAGTLSPQDLQAMNKWLSKTVHLNQYFKHLDTKPTMPHQAKQKATQQTTKSTHLTSVSDSGKYAIQLFASHSQHDAMNFKIQLPKKYRYQIVKQQRGSATWYKVMQGHFKTHAQAEQALKKLPSSLQQYQPWVARLPSSQ